MRKMITMTLMIMVMMIVNGDNDSDDDDNDDNDNDEDDKNDDDDKNDEIQAAPGNLYQFSPARALLSIHCRESMCAFNTWRHLYSFLFFSNVFPIFYLAHLMNRVPGVLGPSSGVEMLNHL